MSLQLNSALPALPIAQDQGPEGIEAVMLRGFDETAGWVHFMHGPHLVVVSLGLLRHSDTAIVNFCRQTFKVHMGRWWVEGVRALRR